MELSETLQKVRDAFLEKSADQEALQRKVDDQVMRLLKEKTKWQHINDENQLKAWQTSKNALKSL